MIDIMDKTPALPAHDVRPEFEYVYHWHRIIPAAASLAIGVGAVLWFWPSSLPSEKAQAVAAAQATASAPLKAKSIVIDLPLQVSKPAEEKIDTAPVQPVAVASVTTPPAAKEPASPVVKQAAPPIANTPTESQKLAALKAINASPAPSAGMKAGQLKVVDGNVKNVALRQVIDHDPLDLNKGAIGLTKKKAVKVVFSANVGKPNQQVNYLWYLNGKLKAKVATRSSGDASSMSSKFISYDAPGAWQVQMTNAEGKVLAESAFAAKRIQ